jgi:hypothetical protein
MALTVIDIFVILALIKVLVKKKKIKLELEKPLILIVGYMLFSIFISIINGTDISTLANLLRGPFYYTIIISFLFLVKNIREVYKFILLISPFVFFNVFTQLYYLITKNNFINIFYPGFRGLVVFESTGDVRPIASGFLLTFFCFVFSFLLIETRDIKISRKYIYFIISTAFLSVIISGTRSWFVIFSFLLFGYFIISNKFSSNLVKIISILMILVVILIISGIITSDFLTKSVFSRLSGILSVAKGDFESVYTLDLRYSVRLPKVLEGVKKHIIFGAGFSEDYMRYRDYHVGFFNTIMQFGIVGFSFFLYFFWKYFDLMKKTIKTLSRINPFRISLKVLALSFGGILLIYFATVYLFPMDSNINRPFFIALFIAITELIVRESKMVEKS